MSSYRYSTAKVNNYKVQILIRLADSISCLSCYSLLVECVEKALSLEARKSDSRVTSNLFELVYAYRVYEERRDTNGVSKLL